MRIALSEMVVEGIKTNIPLHRELLHDMRFMRGGTSIHYLEQKLAAGDEEEEDSPVPWLAITLESTRRRPRRSPTRCMEAGARFGVRSRSPARRAHAPARAARRAGADAGGAAGAAPPAPPRLPPPAFRRRARSRTRTGCARSQSQFAPIRVSERAVDRAELARSRPTRRRSWCGSIPASPSAPAATRARAWCLRWLDAQRRPGGERVLDYGCGSGILAIAAAKLGAGAVDAVDIDPQALETTAANARANGVALRVARAGAPAARQPTTWWWPTSSPQPLIVLEPLLAARTRRGGRIALSGILAGAGGGGRARPTRAISTSRVARGGGGLGAARGRRGGERCTSPAARSCGTAFRVHAGAALGARRQGALRQVRAACSTASTALVAEERRAAATR